MRLVPIIGLTTLLTAGPLVGEALWLQDINPLQSAVAQTAQPAAKAQVTLQLSVAQKSVSKNDKGQTIVTWKPLGNQPAVNPGDILRYTVMGKNNGNQPAKNLVIVQPIPKQTVYNLNSASFSQGSGTISYSLDQGKNFLEKPLVKVKLSNGTVETRPAPAKYYTHIRWKFTQPIAAQQSVTSTYEVTVR